MVQAVEILQSVEMRKTMIQLSFMVNISAADALVTPGAPLSNIV